jgi:hypothetical protein
MSGRDSGDPKISDSSLVALMLKAAGDSSHDVVPKTETPEEGGGAAKQSRTSIPSFMTSTDDDETDIKERCSSASSSGDVGDRSVADLRTDADADSKHLSEIPAQGFTQDFQQNVGLPSDVRTK